MNRSFAVLFASFLAGLVVFPSAAFATDDPKGTEKESPSWNLPKPAFGQFRLVPGKTIPHMTIPQDWSGPWTEFSNFVVRIGASKGHQTSPGNFHFVDPSINLQGATSVQTESSGTTVRLFERASTEEDITVEFAPVPKEIELDHEYLAADISGDNSITTWKVYVRFVSEKPSYIRNPGSQAAD